MTLSCHYWFFKKALSSRFCDAVIKRGLEKKPKLGTIGGKGVKDFKKTRNSNIVWLDDSWIYKEMHPYINLANKNAGGIMIGTTLNHVSLLNTQKINFMIGT